MQRYIKSFATLTDQHISLIKDQYPSGFDKNDLVVMKTGDGRSFEVLEVRGQDAIYLVKVSNDLLEKVDDDLWDLPDNELLGELAEMSSTD
ncbi:MAG: hypothetical protein MK081_02530 [Flavobacteriales bacterium]|nr:hypothetical protein [Flavobacteriales bacterium]